MTDLEFEERLAKAEHSIDRLYTHAIALSVISWVMFILLFLKEFL